jgi:hypothetical protein
MSSYIAFDAATGWRGRTDFDGALPDYPDVPVALDHEGWRRLPSTPAHPSTRLDLYGCSYVFGAGVGVEQIFAARVQAALKDVAVGAVALPAYGTVHAFLHMQRRLRSRIRPACCVFCLLDVHLKRNVASLDYVSNLQGRYWSQHAEPLGLLRAGVGLEGELIVRRLPLARPNLDRADARDFSTDGSYALQVTTRLIEEARRECRAAGAAFAVAVLRRDRARPETGRLLSRCHELGIPAADLSIDRGHSYDLSPTDTHPSAEGHEEYAARLLRFLSSMVCEARERQRA